MKEYTTDDYCRCIAWLINCDNISLTKKFTEKIYTKETIFNYNSHGELFGLYSAIDLINDILKNNRLLDVHIKNIKEILDGNELDIKSEYSTMIGLKILTFLYQTGEDFEKFADTMFDMTLSFKELLNNIKD
jgi:hypothetical protein